MYDLVRDGLMALEAPLSGEQPVDHAQRVVKVPRIEFSVPVMAKQMALGF